MPRKQHDPSPPHVPDDKRAPAQLHELLDVAYANGVWSGGGMELYQAAVVGQRYVAKSGGPGRGRMVATSWNAYNGCEAPWEISAYKAQDVPVEFRTWAEERRKP